MSYDAPFEVPCYAALEAGGTFQSHVITRRGCHENDVVIDIKYAGICHSDIHTARGEWGTPLFPCVPGHEIGGVVAAVGSNVSKFKVGDVVGVGCMVDSCRSCGNCKKGSEQYCKTGAVFTYNSKYKYSHCVECNAEGGATTFGGYSKNIVVDQNFVLSIPTNLDLAAATPLLCAGITVYSPMIRFGLQSHMKFGVIGLGGLGHMAVKFGLAMGCDTTVISRGTAKKDSVMNHLKANNYIDSTNKEEMQNAAGTFDFLLCTIAANFNVTDYISLLRTDGQFIVVGAPPEPLSLATISLIFHRISIAGSLIGGIEETQQMLDFCGRHNITCDIEMINADSINKAYDRAVAGDVKYRFVIDTNSI